MTHTPWTQNIEAACTKKAALFSESPLRYLTRSAFAGAFLTLTTLAGFVTGDLLAAIHPALSRLAFPLVFCWGLIYILFLNGELVTSNMMYLTAGLYRRAVSLPHALGILSLCTAGNLAGAILVGALAAQTSVLASFSAPDAMAGAVVAAKLAKPSAELFFSGILANVFVNIAILSWLSVKNEAARILCVATPIIMFVLLGLEHVVANFGSFSLVYFSGASAAGLSAANTARQWLFAWLGNYIGGGVLIGLAYAWLNGGCKSYRD